MVSDTGGSQGRSGWLNISLFGLDGRVIGGSVAGPLLATSPVQVTTTLICSFYDASSFRRALSILVQVVMGSFVRPASNAKNKGIIARHETGGHESEHWNEDQQRMPPSLPNQNLSSSQVGGGGWSSPRPLDTTSAHLNIDLTRG
ncbi:hypothetical protein GW17_00026544 [Ensete ventricosum]|nr:hypothetical protein GW17_00026544 [Ensete ventricosum]RZS20632.1 hypothetical protein BHM03_00053162 [Ensete ventricosum]